MYTHTSGLKGKIIVDSGDNNPFIILELATAKQGLSEVLKYLPPEVKRKFHWHSNKPFANLSTFRILLECPVLVRLISKSSPCKVLKTRFFISSLLIFATRAKASA